MLQTLTLRAIAWTATILCAASPPADAAPAPIRVAIFDIDAPGVTGADVAQLPDLIAQVITTHAGYEVVPVADLHQSLAAQPKGGSHCSADNACVVAVAHATKADFALVSAYTLRDSTYLLELLRIDGKTSASPKRATDESPDRSRLAAAVKKCLDQLFTWPSPTPAPAAIATSKASTDSPPAPNIAAAPPSPVVAPPSAPSGSPPAVPHRESLALISVVRGEGISDKQATTIEELILGALDATGKFKVIGQSDIAAVLSLDAKKQQAGCDDTDCAVQIAGALGVELVATANLGRLGRNTLLALKVISVRSASVVARAQEAVQSDDDLPAAARALADQVVAARFGIAVVANPAAAQPAPNAVNGAFVATWVTLGIAGAAVIVASVMGTSANRCPTSAYTPVGVGSAVQCQQNFALGSNIGWGVAGAAVVTSGVLALTWALPSGNQKAEGTQAALTLWPGRVAVNGRF